MHTFITQWLLPHSATLAACATLLGCTKYLGDLFKPVIAWAKVHLDEHDLMWEDYCKRNGIEWQLAQGRGERKPHGTTVQLP